MSTPLPVRRPRIVAALVETFGFSPLLATAVALFFLLLLALAVAWLIWSAPPRSVTLTSGPPGSSFERFAKAYQEQLATRGFTLKIVPSGGSRDNLQRLQDAASGVDIGFVQGGLVGETPPPGVMSLGSIAYQPLWVFYRGATRIERLSQLEGKRIGIGAQGSGVQTLAHALLEANGIAAAPTVLVEQASEVAGNDFIAGKLDAIFLMGDSAPTQTVRTLLRTPEVQLYHFTQADAYVRRLTYLNKIILPRGALDFGRDLPAQDVALVGPAVELIAREGLNSAVSDLLLDVARDVHGRATLLARRGEFPAPLEREYPLSQDALKYYKSGRLFTYGLLRSFWLASFVNRILVAVVPIMLVLIPAIRFLPVVYRWSVQLRIYRCYRPLLRIERDAAAAPDRTQTEELLRRLDEIETDVQQLKVPASFAHQFYDLRNHIAFVRLRLRNPTSA
jgi:TRAP-type uncharacterized transport system substrate-binding protein